MHRLKTLLLFAVALFAFGTGRITADEASHDFINSGSAIQVQLDSEQKVIRPGEIFTLALQFEVPEPWHCYWQNPGDVGLGPQLRWILPPGFTVLDVSWPTPVRFDAEEQVGFGYDAPFALLAKVQASHDIRPGDVAGISVDIQWVACSHDMCAPGSAMKSIELPVSSATAWGDSSAFVKARAALPQKISSVRSVHKDTLIALQIDGTFEEDVSVQFFPAEEDVVDHKQTPIILDSQKGLTLALTSHPDRKTNTLNGVVVVQGSQGRKGYAVSASIEEGGRPELIAMLDSKASSASDAAIAAGSSVEFQGGVLLAIGMAFLGGMILNLMPCVLPVISFKVLSFVKMAGEDRRTVLKHGLAFSAGVLGSFWVLASLLLILQAYGRSAGWGFQLQEPLFVGILAAVMTVFGLSMFGLFEFGAFFASWVGTRSATNAKEESYFGSFCSGILATAVATPCTGPFLGSAVGFAVTLPAYQALLIFTSLGLGMAFPYLLLSASPKLLHYFPKPGAWMESFKQFMGFIMIASALWLVWVFGAQTDATAQTVLLGGLFFLAMACWVYGRWGAPYRSQKVRVLSLVLSLILIGFAGKCIISAEQFSTEDTTVTKSMHGGWEPFDADRIAALQEQGIPVFVDFTAKWCLICQANHLILSLDDVSHKMAQQGVVKMKADWTKYDPAITAYLKKFGRNSIPLYLLYSGKPGGQPQILPQVLTRDNVLEALNTVQTQVAEAK